MTDKKYTFVVEHLDPELGPWSALEYKAIAKESQQSGCNFILSSVPQPLLETQDLKDLALLGAEGRPDSIETFFASKKERICLLDPAAKQELEPRDAESFDVFLFGGILGM
jgi:ribosome biogenesis SPOUT family RNA methylase Rps3